MKTLTNEFRDVYLNGLSLVWEIIVVLAKRTKGNHYRSQEVFSVFLGTFQHNAGLLIAQPRRSAVLSPDFFFG
jgi:hypothetical protein